MQAKAKPCGFPLAYSACWYSDDAGKKGPRKICRQGPRRFLTFLRLGGDPAGLHLETSPANTWQILHLANKRKPTVTRSTATGSWPARSTSTEKTWDWHSSMQGCLDGIASTPMSNRDLHLATSPDIAQEFAPDAFRYPPGHGCQCARVVSCVHSKGRVVRASLRLRLGVI